MSYKDTRIWQNSMKIEDASTKKLVSEYDLAWDRACSLSSKIAHDAAGLTLHNEQHFLALWRDLDMLLDDAAILNSTEVFVLGMAILIHDAAHTTLAFEGGIEALAKTPQWADNLALRLKDDLNSGPLPSLAELDECVKRAVTFETVRSLHAEQATKVLTLAFKHPSLDTEFYLIQDPSIRSHFGEIIGKIAASHHWGITEVAKLRKSQHMPSPFGTIRPVYLAALMTQFKLTVLARRILSSR
jgi:hypothetical protein